MNYELTMGYVALQDESMGKHARRDRIKQGGCLKRLFDDYVIAGLTRNPLIISNIFSWDPASSAG